MIAKLIDLYYTEEWEEIAPHGLNQFLCERMKAARSCVQPAVWELLYKGWFHDTFVLNLTCTMQGKGMYLLRLSIEKEVEQRKIDLEFSDVSLFRADGNILDVKASFPAPCNEKPIAQIMDIWVEKNNKLACCILFDNNRSLYVHCDKIRLLQ